MESYLHRIIGIYASTVEAEQAHDMIVKRGIKLRQISLLLAGSVGAGSDSAFDSDEVLKDILRDGTIGTAVGTAAAAGVSIALAAANLTLFIASPVLGTLYLLGWGASLGGSVGAMAPPVTDRPTFVNLSVQKQTDCRTERADTLFRAVHCKFQYDSLGSRK